ncbi:uncharacterized protein LOC143101375 isoform X2 [Alosa pseudoharengus]|uniref:uncharacterized protein LOC143101375 isoform X2 n=1 Tax=Alosa pseudoharengus TaxID=34774 RepID=UPI003F8AF20A
MPQKRKRSLAAQKIFAVKKKKANPGSSDEIPSPTNSSLVEVNLGSSNEVGRPHQKKAQPNEVGRPRYKKAQPMSDSVCQNLSKPVKTHQNLSKPVKTCPNLSKPVKTCQNLSNFVKQSPAIHTVPNLLKNVSPDLSTDVSPDPDVSPDVSPDVCPDVSTDMAVGVSVGDSTCVKEQTVTVSSSLTKSDEFPDISVLMGSFHQGHSRFGNVRNKQCGAISFTAVLKSKIKNVWAWGTQDLDDVLIKGTALYSSMKAEGRIRDHLPGRGYIAVSELPRYQRLWSCVFAISFGESYTGFIHIDDYDHDLRDVAMPYDVAMQRALFGNDACLLTICANTCAIVNEETRFAFVDSHASRRVNQQGQKASCVLYFSSVQSLFSFVYEFAGSFGTNTVRFEVTGVKVLMTNLDPALPSQINEAVESCMLLQVILELEKHAGRKLIMGDFNEDIFRSSTIVKLLEQHGYTQQVQAATTERASEPKEHIA